MVKEHFFFFSSEMWIFPAALVNLKIKKWWPDEHVEWGEAEYESIRLFLGVDGEDTRPLNENENDSDDGSDESSPIPQVSRITGRIIKLPARYRD